MSKTLVITNTHLQEVVFLLLLLIVKIGTHCSTHVEIFIKSKKVSKYRLNLHSIELQRTRETI